MIKRLLRATAIALVLLLFVALPVLAMANPDAIAFYCVGSVPIYKVFYNVNEADDRLFVAEQYVHYAVSQNYTAGEAFLFEVLNATGNETIASTPLNQYEAKPISIYMSAAQVATAGLSVGDANVIRITGNPLVFPSPTGNTVNTTLGVSDYVNQEFGQDGGVAEANNLRNFMIDMADDLEVYDLSTGNITQSTLHIVTVQGVRYLTTTGGSIFLEGVPGLDVMCPILFQYSSAPMPGDEPESTGAYQSTLTPLAKWGKTSADGLTNLGIYLGINQALAGSAVLFTFVALLAIYVYSRTQSGISVLLLVGTMPFLGAWLGLFAIGLAFVYVIVIVVLLGFFFLSRGAL